MPIVTSKIILIIENIYFSLFDVGDRKSSLSCIIKNNLTTNTQGGESKHRISCFYLVLRVLTANRLNLVRLLITTKEEN